MVTSESDILRKALPCIAIASLFALALWFVDRPSTTVEIPVLNKGPIHDLASFPAEKLQDYLKSAPIGTSVKISGLFLTDKAQWANLGNADGHIIVPFSLPTAAGSSSKQLFVWANKTVGDPVPNFKDGLPTGTELIATIRWNESVQNLSMNEAYKKYVAAIGQIGGIPFFDGVILELASPDGDTVIYHGETPNWVIVSGMMFIISLASFLFLLRQGNQKSTSAKNWKRREDGASIIEYVLLIALLSLIALTAVRTVGKTSSCKFAEAAVQIGDHSGYLNQDLINQFPDCCAGKVMVCTGVPAPPNFCQCLTGPPPPPPPVW